MALTPVYKVSVKTRRTLWLPVFTYHYNQSCDMLYLVIILFYSTGTAVVLVQRRAQLSGGCEFLCYWVLVFLFHFLSYKSRVSLHRSFNEGSFTSNVKRFQINAHQAVLPGAQ